jgi:hypothetical protein
VVGWYRQIVDVRRVQAVSDVVQAAAIQVGIDAQTRFATDPHEDPRFVELQQRCAAHPALEALRQAPGLRSLLRRLCGGPVVGGQGDVVRAVAPGQPPTPVHQDAAYVADPQTVTVWIPLTSCPLELGPVGIVAESATGPILEHGPAGILDTGAFALTAQPMELGDVLLFTARTIHGALPNRADRMRFSIDLRFVRA